MKRSSNEIEGEEGFGDDFWCVTGLPGVGGVESIGEDFSIDNFFGLNAAFSEEEDEDEEEKDSSSLSLSSHDLLDDFSHGLAIPVDDIQGLELWSNVMDHPVPGPIFGEKSGFHSTNRFGPGRKPVQSCVPFVIPSVIPGKPRTKRLRTGSNRSWLTALPTSIDTPSSSSSPTSVFYSFGKPAVNNKPRKKPGAVGGEAVGGGGGPLFQRRCTHCLTTKTPQWRAGPNGSKTLCNACGVRYKSGRLFPEYRPACSPTFVSEIHSNSHRKVLEMRKRKEIGETAAV